MLVCRFRNINNLNMKSLTITCLIITMITGNGFGSESYGALYEAAIEMLAREYKIEVTKDEISEVGWRSFDEYIGEREVLLQVRTLQLNGEAEEFKKMVEKHPKIATSQNISQYTELFPDLKAIESYQKTVSEQLKQDPDLWKKEYTDLTRSVKLNILSVKVRSKFDETETTNQKENDEIRYLEGYLRKRFGLGIHNYKKEFFWRKKILIMMETLAESLESTVKLKQIQENRTLLERWPVFGLNPERTVTEERRKRTLE